MIQLLIRRPQPQELNPVRAVVQSVVDEIYGGLWAPPPLPVDESGWDLSWIAVLEARVVAWFGQAENRWMIYGCYAEVADVELASVCSHTRRLK